jgi:Raf kinase inhibitor-like YbhB/YbcL family protein
MTVMRSPALALLTAVLVLAGCSKSPAAPALPVAGSLTVTSTDFRDGAVLPAAFTCTGGGRRPELSWSGATAAAWAIVVDDPDAPGGDFYHWVVTDLPGGTTSLPGGTTNGGTTRVGGSVPAGATELKNSGGSTGWTPPCPPSGTHHYRFTVYALKAPVGLAPGGSLSDAFGRITKAASAQGRLTGLVAHAG